MATPRDKNAQNVTLALYGQFNSALDKWCLILFVNKIVIQIIVPKE
jgi:hypothetical protein